MVFLVEGLIGELVFIVVFLIRKSKKLFLVILVNKWICMCVWVCVFLCINIRT